MSDNVPSKELAIKRTELEIHSLEQNLMRQDVRKLEIEDEKSKLEENRKATLRSIEELRAKLTKLKG